jgi:hypothetical protein
MFWRGLVIAGYVALAVAVGIAYGIKGLAILSIFYVWAGAWAVFILAWNWLSRAAGRLYSRRLVGSR